MSTGAIITIVVLAVLVVAGLALLAVLVRRADGGGASLRRRFGPEYERTVARHDGDTKAAEHELKERVERHGALRMRELPPHQHEQYVALWAGVQEQFVESPREAAVQADRLIGQLAAERGYPDPAHHDDQIDALSVHHAHTVHGYRAMHAGAAGGASTEELRHAMLNARALFEELVSTGDKHHHRKGERNGRHADRRHHALPGYHRKGATS